MAQAMAQAVALTASERPAMASRPGSRETMSCSAVLALAEKEVMRQFRHRERSVAIHDFECMDCRVASLLAMTNL